MRLLPLKSLVAIALVSAACAAPRASGRTSPLVGKRVELTLTDLGGRSVRVPPEDARLTVVDFWATWCEPCREQLPFLSQLAADYGARGVAVYAVSFDEDLGAVRDYVSKTSVMLPVLWEKGGGTIAEKLDVTRLPTTVLIDAQGVVRAVHLGFDRAEGAALERDVRRLLGD